MIEAKGLSMVYQDGTEALHEVCFEIPEGESCSIIGPSGCGKTSLLFIFSGILKPTSGKALIAGREVSRTFARSGIDLTGLWLVTVENGI